MAIPKRLRFEVLRRDGHRCRYCGIDGVPLEVDHVVPRVLGGSDTDPANLVTACGPCNAGKSSSMPGAPTVADVRAIAHDWAEGKAVTTADHVEAAEDRVGAQEQFDRWWTEYGNSRPQNWRNTIDAFTAAGLTLPALGDCVRVACNRENVREPFLYMCGIAWRKIAALQDGNRNAADTVAAAADRAELFMQLDGMANLVLTELDEVDHKSYVEAAGEDLQGLDATEDEVYASAAVSAFLDMRWDQGSLRRALEGLLDRLPDETVATARSAARDRRADPEHLLSRDDAELSYAAGLVAQALDEQVTASLPDDDRLGWVAYVTAWLGTPKGEHIGRVAKHVASLIRTRNRGGHPHLYGMCGGKGGESPTPTGACGKRSEFMLWLDDCKACQSPPCGGHVACGAHLEKLVEGSKTELTLSGHEPWEFPKDPEDPWAPF